MRVAIAAAMLLACVALQAGTALGSGLPDYRQAEVRAAIAQLTRDAVWTQLDVSARGTLPRRVAGSGVLENPAGAFVTYSRNGVTVGCWGTVAPRTVSLAEEVQVNAIKALTMDRRFRPIRRGDLAGLVAHVSVIGPLEPVTSAAELWPRRFGLLVGGAGKGGVLLPGEAATATWQIATCRRKAGLRLRERASMYRFETVVIGPIALAPVE